MLNQTREVTHQRLKNDKTALEIKDCANTWNSISAADEIFLYTLQGYFRVLFC